MPQLKLIRGAENGRSLLEHAILLFSDAYLDEVGSGSELTNSSWCVGLLHLIDDLLASEHDEYADILQLGNRLNFLDCEGSYVLAAQKAKNFLADRYGVQFDLESPPGSRVPLPLSPVPLINAALSGVLIGIAEYRVTEVSSSGAFHESELLLESCRPVTEESPSTVERMMLAGRNRILGKILKDQGKWEEAARCLELFCTDCLLPGTYFEGWATADWSQVLMELGRYEEGEAVIQRLLRERQDNVLFQTERKLADRQDDAILLQINWAESKLQQGFLSDAKSRIEAVLKILHDLGSLSHYEKTRVYSMYTNLARISHLQKNWNEAKLLWQKALDYGQTIAPSGVPWGRAHFYVQVAVYSLADVEYELGNLEAATLLRTEAENSEAFTPENRMFWMLGLGTYWLQEMEKKCQRGLSRSGGKPHQNGITRKRTTSARAIPNCKHV